jgi:hypothetical protein
MPFSTAEDRPQWPRNVSAARAGGRKTSSSRKSRPHPGAVRRSEVAPPPRPHPTSSGRCRAHLCLKKRPSRGRRHARVYLVQETPGSSSPDSCSHPRARAACGPRVCGTSSKSSRKGDVCRASTAPALEVPAWSGHAVPWSDNASGHRSGRRGGRARAHATPRSRCREADMWPRSSSSASPEGATRRRGKYKQDRHP